MKLSLNPIMTQMMADLQNSELFVPLLLVVELLVPLLLVFELFAGLLFSSELLRRELLGLKLDRG